MIEDWGGTIAEIDIEVIYADGRATKQLKGVMVCRLSGLLSIKTIGRGRIQSGYNVLVNGSECKRLGLDPEQVVIDQGPSECVLHFGENPGGITIQEFVPPRRITIKRSTCINCDIRSTILLGRGYCTDCYGEC